MAVRAMYCKTRMAETLPVHSISAGLDYPGVGPEHSYLKDIGRAEYVSITDDEAVNAFQECARLEGDHSCLRGGTCYCLYNEIRSDVEQ